MLFHPNAKINIGLYVVRKRPDGYHDLETVFYPIPLRDTLEITPLKDGQESYILQMNGMPIAGNADDNLVVRVFKDVQAEFGLPALHIRLHKNIPTGAGLGGGSSDAAYMLKALNACFNLNLTVQEMERRIAKYGADCAFFIREQPSFATGIGDCLTPLPFSLKGWTLVLVKPPVAVATREAYAGVCPGIPACDLRAALLRPVEEWRTCVSNDFETSVFKSHPTIGAIKQKLYDLGAVYAAMSGSGSTVFALFRHKQDCVEEVFKDCFVFQDLLQI